MNLLRLYGYGEVPEPPASMDEATVHAIAHMAASSGTRGIRDRAAQAALIRSARTPEERVWIMQIIMASRRHWLTWLTEGQRKWQASVSRRPSKARHHDSISIREKYVRALA